MVLLDLSSTGLNLWAVQEHLIGLQIAKSQYVLPSGTLDILNAIISSPTQVEGTEAVGAQSVTTTLSEATQVVRVGLNFEAISASETITLEYSNDSGTTWESITTLTKTDWATGEWYWIDLDPMVTSDTFRVSSTTDPITTSQFYLAISVRDIPMYPYNRDDYMSQVNKNYSVGIPTNYFFEKLINPTITLWGVPSNDTVHLSVRIHRQMEDVGSLTDELAIPDRWLNSVIWSTAATAAFELPDISDTRLQLLQGKAESSLANVETDETDSAPIYMSPMIGNYNG